jgi:hypothetical protein
MSDTNFDGKLQKTISMMQEINHLMSDAMSQSQMHQDESFTKEAIVTLKQSILNQNHMDFLDAMTKLENPPKIIVELQGNKVEIIDQDILKELKENFQKSQSGLELSKESFSEAKTDAVAARNQLVEKDQVKNILESELDQLYNQIASLLSTVQSEGKSALKNMEKDKDLIKDFRDGDSKNKSDSKVTADEDPYFKGNLQVTDFHKAIDSSPIKTSHMSIEAVEDR